MRLATPADGRSPLVLATLGGEQHELGLLMVGLLACSRQVPVCYLGPRAPVEEVVQVAARTGAAAVGVGVVHVADAAALARDLDRLARQLGKVALWAGGAGLGALDGQALPRRMLRIQGIAELEAALEELLAAR
jgi:cobalamin-dependent methionine synthase I